ncbi:hypothetical protein HAX54_035453 [Datura stramonium]|uniref:F-box domain-containing protein n=1 Tax=Datura stramonium TaxID=4076 RepID=A0ABS8SFB6_DATST|nr:hypothetical protein [Datura stramonium]
MSPIPGRHGPSELTAEGIAASGLTSEKLSLPTLQSKMKCDPEGYESELTLVYNQFKSSMDLFEQQAALNFTSLSGVSTDPTVSKDLGDRAMFLSHVTPFYPKQLVNFPKELAQLLRSSARTLPSGLRVHVTQALILLINRKIVDIGDTLALFMELQTLGDRVLRKLAFSHIVHSIRRMNQKHKNDTKNRALQNILFALLQQEDEAKAKRSLITLCELHRRKVWFDDRTANAICSACFHSSSRIMVASLSFLLDYEKIEDDSDSDMEDSEDEQTANKPQVVLNKEAIYKAHNKGTSSSKKKKQAKLQRAVRSMKKQQRVQSENNNTSYYSPLNHLKDAQGFAEKLFSHLQTCNERFEVKMMMLKVIARTVGLHHLILLNFYPYLQRYVQPHQRDVTNLLAAAVQACHDMVPPDAVEPLFKQVVNQFVHDRSRPEAISVGINVIREICLRMPLLMTEDLLQDLVLYKKSNEKAVSAAARSLLTLFREVCPSLLVKKDRGRPTNPKARPKAFGEVSVASSIPGIELLDQEDNDSDDDVEKGSVGLSDHDDQSDEDVDLGEEDVNCEINGDNASDNESGDDECDSDEDNRSQAAEEFSEDDDAIDSADATEDDESDGEEEDIDDSKMQDHSSWASEEDDVDEKESKGIKRKMSDIDLNAASNSLRALKKLAGAKLEHNSLNMEDGILSNEDFQRIKELKAKKDARTVLAQHGFKLPSSDQLSTKRVDAAKLEANIRKKLSKEERLAIIRAGREDRGRYQAKTALKKKKTGGSSNQQKEHKKFMPLAAKRSKGKRVVMDVDGAMGIHWEEEIIMDILSRLPVKSLLRFKCVSKFWMTLISEPYFTRKHLNHAKNNQHSQKILLLNGEFSLQYSSDLTSASLSPVQLVKDVQKLDLPFSREQRMCRLYCCYDGLALIGVGNYPEYKRLTLLLWNPSTRESIVLPDPEFPPDVLCTWGLGYDSTSGDYKILRIDHRAHCEILALKSGSWREIDKHPNDVYPAVFDDLKDSLAFVDGAFHWLDSYRHKPVVSFNISNEVYGEIPLPEGVLVASNMDYIKDGISVFGGMLCVCSTHIHMLSLNYIFKLWVMKDYGIKESWNQLFTIQGVNILSITPKYMFSDGEVLLLCIHLERTGYVFKTSKESSVLWPQSDSECIQNGFVYTESLISPKLLSIYSVLDQGK